MREGFTVEYSYKTKGVCSSRIDIELEGNVIKKIKFFGGCKGNLEALSRLIPGMTVEETAEMLEGLRCGSKLTSCADQLVKACKEALSAGGEDSK